MQSGSAWGGHVDGLVDVPEHEVIHRIALLKTAREAVQGALFSKDVWFEVVAVAAGAGPDLRDMVEQPLRHKIAGQEYRQPALKHCAGEASLEIHRSQIIAVGYYQSLSVQVKGYRLGPEHLESSLPLQAAKGPPVVIPLEEKDLHAAGDARS